MGTWHTLADLSTGQVVTETHWDQLTDCINYLHSPNNDLVKHTEGSDYTTTSTSFVDVDATDLAQTITTTGGNVLVLAQAVVLNSSATRQFFDIAVDGTRFGSANTFGIAVWDVNDSFDYGSVNIAIVISGLSADSHTFKLQWRVEAGSATMYSTAGTHPVVFHVIEL